MPNFLTTAEVADLLRQPEQTIRYWRFLGKGPRSWKAGRRVLYDEADVLTWIEEQQAAQAANRGGDAA